MALHNMLTSDVTVKWYNINACTQIWYVTNIDLQTSTNVTVIRVRMELHVTTKLTPTTALVWKATTAPIARLVCFSKTNIKCFQCQ